jgi:hypothetical protein
MNHALSSLEQVVGVFAKKLEISLFVGLVRLRANASFLVIAELAAECIL